MDGTFGENLAWSMSSSRDFRTDLDTTATARWYSEIKDYDFSKPGFGYNTGHFTQVVWKSSTKLGCGTASDGPTVYVTCRYKGAGNMMGAFPDNVLPLTDGSGAPADDTAKDSDSTTPSDPSSDPSTDTTTPDSTTDPADPAPATPAPTLQSGSGSSPSKQEHDPQKDEFPSLAPTLRSPSICLLYTSPSPRDYAASRMPSSA